MSFVTPRQVQTVQIARRQVEKASNGAFDESAWQLALRNCGVRPDAAGRCSSKCLTQAGFEKLMAVLVSLGFRDSRGDEHWQSRNSARTGLATSRQVREIHRLAKLAPRYPLHTLCRRVSNHAHSEPERLTMTQAHALIEALKDIDGREHAKEDKDALTQA